MSFDPESKTWTSHSPSAVALKHRWNNKKDMNFAFRHFIRRRCPEMIQTMNYSLSCCQNVIEPQSPRPHPPLWEDSQFHIMGEIGKWWKAAVWQVVKQINLQIHHDLRFPFPPGKKRIPKRRSVRTYEPPGNCRSLFWQQCKFSFVDNTYQSANLCRIRK